jgi:hypothetical protein
MMRLLCLLISVLLAACNLVSSPPDVPTPTPAERTCDQIVTDAVQAVAANCANTGPNQACYGHPLVEAQFRSGIQATFARAGDLAQLQGLRLLSTSPMNESQQAWGLALVQAQTNLASQSVTVVLYGGATLDNISPAMDAVVLSTGFGSASTCAPPAAALIQSPAGTQVNLNINGANIALGSTIYLTAQANGQLTLATINGTAVVEAAGLSQTVNAGAQTTLPLGGSSGLQVNGPPTAPQPFAVNTIQLAPLNLLPVPVQLPAPISPAAAGTPTLPGLPITPTLPPVTIPLPPTAIPTACVPRSDWAFTYTVEAGDTLFGIAQRFGLSLAELQSGNCIADANIINVGQTLRVPAPLEPTATATTTTTPQPTITFTPTVPDYEADRTSLTAGECTLIRWQVENIDSVFFQGQPTTGDNQQEVCPTETTRYTLLVVQPDGNQIPYFLTIEVEPETNEEAVSE